MNTLIFFLIIINILIPCFYAIKYSFYKEGIAINHILLFSIGFIFYWIIPIVIGISRSIDSSFPFMYQWYSIFDSIEESTIIWYLFSCFIFYLSFICGTILANKKLYSSNYYFKSSKTGINHLTKINLGTSKFVLNCLTILISLPLLLYFIYYFNNSFFKGYAGELSLDDFKGTFASLTLFMLSIAIIWIALLESKKQSKVKFNNLIFNNFLYIYLFASILLTSLGGRLYLLHGVVTITAYRSIYFKSIDFLKLLISCVVIIFAAALIAFLRLNDGEGVNIFLILFYIFSESLFTGVSTLAFIKDLNPIKELLNAPIFLASGFTNLVPSFIIPPNEKASLAIDPIDFGYEIYTPIGALSSYVSWIINFGFLGTCVSLFIISFLLSLLIKKRHSPLLKVMYVCISSSILTTFFRDPFSISIVKFIFQFSICIPNFIFSIISLINQAEKKERAT